jgi:hypothetical protein
MEHFREMCLAEFEEASDEETRLWKIVGEKCPGRSGYDPRLWQQWLDALAVSTGLADILRESLPAQSAGCG